MASTMKPVDSSPVNRMQAEALALHRRGRFGEAMSLLDRAITTDDANSLLLRARLSITRSPSGAIATLHDARFLGYSLRDQAEAALLRGRAYAKLGEYETAEQSFTSAHALLKECGIADRDLFREIEVSLGTMMIAQSRIDEADGIGKALLQREKSAQVAAIFVLLAQIAWRREELEKNAAYLLQALRSIPGEAIPDVQLWAETLRQLAYVLQFVPSAALREAAAHHVAALPWTDELADLRSQVYRLLGTRAILDGAITEGFALYKRASTTPAASLHVRIIAILTGAELARWLAEPYFFEENLLEATALSQQVDWRSVAPGARQILLLLAQMHAHRDSALALSFAAHFEALGGYGPDHSGYGRVAVAQEKYCLGLLYAETGEKQKGVELLEAAFAEHVRLRFDWPAGQAAIVLAEITNSLAWRSRERTARPIPELVYEQALSTTRSHGRRFGAQKS